MNAYEHDFPKLKCCTTTSWGCLYHCNISRPGPDSVDTGGHECKLLLFVGIFGYNRGTDIYNMTVLQVHGEIEGILESQLPQGE